MGDVRLAAREVTFRYGRRRDPLVARDWTAEFRAGEVTAITGPSGCGKSTRLYLLALMLRPFAGAIEVDGQRVDRLSDAARARLRAERFGFVFQDAALDTTRTVADNVIETALYRRTARGDEMVSALLLLNRFAPDVPPARRPGQISGGQAQRIALCRALLGRPEIVLADEPTGNLDPATSAVVLSALRETADRGGCVVVVTHDPIVARWADRTIALDATA